VNDIRQALARAWDTPRGSALQTHIRTTLGWDASASALERTYELARSRKATATA